MTSKNRKMPILIGLGIFIILVIAFFTQFTVVQHIYTQEELEKIYNECDGVSNHYFFDGWLPSSGVRCFNIDTSMSYIYGDCDRILEYEKNNPPFFKRLHKCANVLEMKRR